MKVLFVINGLSRSLSTVKKEAERLKELTQGHQIDILITKFAGDAFRFAHDFDAQQGEAIIACGGDGTLNEVVNGAYYANHNHDMHFAHYPCGSANDLARVIGRKSLEELLAKVLSSDYKRIDCSYISRDDRTRRFVNESSAGIGALVCRGVELNRKTIPPTLNYLWNSIIWLMRYKRPIIRVELDDRSYEGEVMLAVIGKGKFLGNGLGLIPQANLDDAQFGVTIISNATLWEFATLRKHVASGNQLDRDNIFYYTSKKVKIKVLSGTLPIETDGEYYDILHENEELEYNLLPSCLRICC